MESEFVHAAHLFPYRSKGLMDLILREGSVKDLSSPVNGLFLYPKIEAALSHLEGETVAIGAADTAPYPCPPYSRVHLGLC